MAVGFEKLVKDTADTIKRAGKSKTSEYDTNGVVKRIDGKTAWVHFDGGVDETPVKMTISAKAGDKVRVHVGGGKAYITGNETAPPTDDREAKKANSYAGEAYKIAMTAQESADKAKSTAESMSEQIDDIEELVGDGDESGITITIQYYLSTSNTEPIDGEWSESLPEYVEGCYYWTRTVTTYADGSEVEGDPVLDVTNQIAAEVNSVVTAENQHFWHDSTGAYVTNAEGSYSSGYAMKITTYGLLQTYNGNNLMSLTSSGLNFYQSDGSTPLATYSSSGATIYGGSTSYRAVVSSDGLNVYYNNILTASFGSTVSIGDGSNYNLSMDASSLAIKSGSSSVFSVTGSVLNYNGSPYSIHVYTSGFNVMNGTTTIFSVNSSGTSASGALSVGGSVTLNSTVASNSVSTYNVGMGSAFKLGVYSSSRDKKTNISYEIEDEFDPHQLYNLPVVTFRWKDEYKDQDAWDKDRKQIGFIAEDVHDTYYVGAIHDSTGKTIDWSHRTIIPAMLYLIQEQKKEIDYLTNRVTILEERSRA